MQQPAVETADLAGLAAVATGRGVVWALASADLNINLVVLGPGEAVGAHVNREVDVLLLGLAGEGVVTAAGVAHPLAPQRLVLVPQGVERAVRAGGARLVYLTCHRRRGGLLPAPGVSHRSTTSEPSG